MENFRRIFQTLFEEEDKNSPKVEEETTKINPKEKIFDGKAFFKKRRDKKTDDKMYEEKIEKPRRRKTQRESTKEKK